MHILCSWYFLISIYYCLIIPPALVRSHNPNVYLFRHTDQNALNLDVITISFLSLFFLSHTNKIFLYPFLFKRFNNELPKTISYYLSFLHKIYIVVINAILFDLI